MEPLQSKRLKFLRRDVFKYLLILTPSDFKPFNNDGKYEFNAISVFLLFKLKQVEKYFVSYLLDNQKSTVLVFLK